MIISEGVVNMWYVRSDIMNHELIHVIISEGIVAMWRARGWFMKPMKHLQSARALHSPPASTQHPNRLLDVHSISSSSPIL